MSKPFFFKIIAADLLNFATDPEGEGMTLLRFAKELQKGESDISFIQDVIDEAKNYSQSKQLAGRLGGLAKASSAKADPSSAKAKVSTPLARSSSSSISTTEHKEPKTVVSDNLFDTFWELYPKKVSKKPSKKWWDKNVKTELLANKIIDGIKKHTPSLLARERQYIPDPSTWLNKEKWNDEVELTSQQKNNQNEGGLIKHSCT